MAAVEQFAVGPGRQILDKIQTEAARHPAGLSGVMADMKPGGAQAALRAEFDTAMKNPDFARAYGAVKATADRYGQDRVAVNNDIASRGLGPARAGAFERTDATVGEELSRIPGKEPGKSALDELAAKVAEVLREAIEKVRAAISGAMAGMQQSAAPSPSPSPGMSP